MRNSANSYPGTPDCIRLNRLAAGLVSFTALLAGCGSAARYNPRPADATFAISVSRSTVSTDGQLRLNATLATGSPAAVSWRVVEGQNDPALGQGRIDATGLYTPPPALSSDSINVLVAAQLQSGLGDTASAVLTVRPGFLQPLTPETATLGANAALLVTAQIAEVNGGTMHWLLSRDGRQVTDGSAGSIASQGCRYSPRNYTVCTALYTAPANLYSGDGTAIVTANIGDGSGGASAPVFLRLSAEGITSTPLANQAAQPGPLLLGASGGNTNDYDADEQGNLLECCGGTLGALLEGQGGSQYILSNNHVLAESDQASAGDTIQQPGLIDSACSSQPERGSKRPVAALKYFVPLGTSQSNVDAALAQVSPGAVEANGAILQLAAPVPAEGNGTVSNLAAAPPAGGKGEAIGAGSFHGDALQVAKSGRTTGLTCSTIDAIDLDVEVDYFKDCAETRPYLTKTFTGQLGIPGSSFADSGDSGALVVDARNAEPVGLLFATGSNGSGTGYSIANPIRDVLTELGSQSGQQLSVVGGAEHPVACLDYDASRQALPNASNEAAVSAALRDKAAAAVHTALASLVDRSTGILGAAPGRSVDNPRDAAVILYVEDRAPGHANGGQHRPNLGVLPTIPALIDGVRTVVVVTDRQTLDLDNAPQQPVTSPGIHLPAEVLGEARNIQRRFAKQLLQDPAIFGVGVTQSRDHASEAALLVLVDSHGTPESTPAVLGGLRVRYVYLDRFHVTRSKYAPPRSSGCKPPVPDPWSFREQPLR